MSAITVATWNVNGMRARHAQFLDWLANARPDVVCLQEVKATREQLAPEILDLDGYTGCWHCAGPYSGVSLNVRRDAFADLAAFEHPTFDRETRVVQARAGNIVFACVYVPNGGKDFADKLKFLTEMQAWVAQTLSTGLDLVLCGDLNVTRTDLDVHPTERNPKAVGQRLDERSQFEDLLDEGLVDLGRTLHPDDDGLFTWWAPWRNHRQRNIGWRIDYILASSSLAERVRAFEVQREIGSSDHAPVLATFEDIG